MVRNALTLTAYFIPWAVVHSLLASLPVKRWARRRLGPGVDRWYRLAYVLFASVTLVPVMWMMVVLPDRALYVVPPPWRYLMLGGQILALAGMAGAVLQTGPTYFLGLSQLFTGRSRWGGELQVRGLYCHVRHPIYLFGILFVWLTPVMTVNWLTLYALITLYFVLGSVHEERRLIAEFGDAYREYRRQVPRLLPRPGTCYEPPEG